MLKTIISKYVSFLSKHLILCSLLVISITYSAIPYSIALFKNIKTEFKVLLPEGRPSVQRLEKLIDVFGNVKDVIIIIETKNPEKTKEMIPRLAEYLKQVPGVKEIDWRKRGYDFFDKHKFYFISKNDLMDIRDRIDRRIQREKLGQLYIDLESDEEKDSEKLEIYGKDISPSYAGNVTSEYLVDESESLFLIRVYPTSKKIDAKFFKASSKNIMSSVANFGIDKYDTTAKVHYAGGVITGAHQYNTVIGDLRIAGLISGSLILLLIIIYYRCIRSLFLVIIPLVCGIIWNFALTCITIGNLNMITAFLISILFGLGIDFGIHLNSRYNEERFNGVDLHTAIVNTLANTGRSTFTACMTTATAFIVLAINDFKGFSEFGIIAGIGIIITLLSYFTILPLMFMIEDKFSILRRKNFKVTSWHLKSIINLPKRIMLTILVVVIVVSTTCAVAFLKFDYNFKNYEAPNAELKTAKELYSKVTLSKAIPSAVLVHSDEDAIAVKRILDERIKRNPKSVMKAARNVFSLLPKDQEEKIPIIREIGALLDDDIIEKVVNDKDKERLDNIRMSSKAMPFEYDEVPSNLKSLFIDEQTGPLNQLVYIFLKRDIDLKDGNSALALAKESSNIDIGNGKVYHATSSAIVFADVLTVMLQDSPKAIIASLIAVIVLLLIDFKNIKYTLIAMTPLIAGICLMLGIMASLNYHLGFFNMIVLPVILGIGIDDGVHFFHRFKEEGFRNIQKVMSTTGGAIVMTSLTTAFGFGGMLIAHHRGLASIGIAAIIGILCCLGATLFFLPAILKKIWNIRDACSNTQRKGNT